MNDNRGTVVAGCVHHAARILASLTDGTVEPLSVPGAAITVYKAARRLPSMAHRFDQLPGTVEEVLAVPQDSEVTRAEVLALGELDRVRASVLLTDWEGITGPERERLFLIGTGELEPTTADLERIARAAGVSVEWLLGSD
ncbi:hypothetical protein [Streptomyces tsukubensis]|uniref:hypothetical protein n=1 Tax=Streptomyces tsukubensis TaxID=83656 RepID=UPI00344E1C85